MSRNEAVLAGRMLAAATIDFLGRLNPAQFLEFVEHRAGRLDLQARVTVLGRERVSVSVTGQPDLIDAFEMACSLGPLDCLVLDVIRHNHTNHEFADKDGAIR